ncbi:helix-turn-helix domain-containing protein [Calidithermus roseus]|nr:helix-turn-helix domain-containing protein [Calidithermus roseus]
MNTEERVMTLGERLRSFRQNRFPSLRKAAEAAGVSVAYLSKLESDEAGNPTLEVLNRLASAYGVTLEELTGGGPGPAPAQALPPSLEEFVREYRERYPELGDPDWQRMLLGIRLRGKYPERGEDWHILFLQLKRALE